MTTFDFTELVSETRTTRRFRQEVALPQETLEALINLARLGGSARNLQPIKYVLVNTPAQNEIIFPHLGWAGYLTNWPGPVEGERPAAYIICLLDTTISNECDFDLGIASQNILLGAALENIAGCRIASFSPKLKTELQIPEHLVIQLVIALGIAKEKIVIDPVGTEGSIQYWRDNEETHHVPKRSLNGIIYKL